MVDLWDTSSAFWKPQFPQFQCRMTQVLPNAGPVSQRPRKIAVIFFPKQKSWIHTARDLLFTCDTDAFFRVCMAAEHNCGRHSIFKLSLPSPTLSWKRSCAISPTFSHNSWIMHKKLWVGRKLWSPTDLILFSLPSHTRQVLILCSKVILTSLKQLFL